MYYEQSKRKASRSIIIPGQAKTVEIPSNHCTSKGAQYQVFSYAVSMVILLGGKPPLQYASYNYYTEQFAVSLYLRSTPPIPNNPKAA